MTESINENSTLNKMGDANGVLPHRRFTDIHCHCLPGVDDGPATFLEAFSLCQALVADGITTVIATPHQLGRFSDCNEAAQIRETVFSLNESLKTNGIDLNILPGGDVRVDERICELLESDKILTLADGGKYILLELPHQIFLDIEPLIAELSSMGIQTIISHPERHHTLANQQKTPCGFQMRNTLGIPQRWLDYPVHLQITAGSLLGDFGPEAQQAGWYFLRTGLASLIATDCHDLSGRRPCMKEAFEAICAKLGKRIACQVCIDNPAKIIKGQDMESLRSVGTRMCSNEPLSDF